MAKKTLAPNARSAAPSEAIPCAHETCDLPAVCRIETSTGWANLCEPHYVMHYDTAARKRCAELGLLQRQNETRPQWRARMMAYIREHAKPRTFADAAVAEDEWSATA